MVRYFAPLIISTNLVEVVTQVFRGLVHMHKVAVRSSRASACIEIHIN